MSDSEQEQHPEHQPPARARRRHGPPPIPEIGTIEEAGAFLLFGIITGNAVAAVSVTELIEAETLAEVGSNILKDLAIKVLC